MAQIIRAYLIPPTPLEEILNGVEMDLTITRYPNFALLEQYCYRVASAVGLVSIDIFGCRHPRSRDYAVALGMAFQLTNILRDVKKDASFGRIYLPQDEMAAFGVSEADIVEDGWSENMRQLFRFQHHRARHYYAKALRLIAPPDRPKLIAAEIMREVYEGLLDEIERRNFDVVRAPVKLDKFAKMRPLPARQVARKENAAAAPAAKKGGDTRRRFRRAGCGGSSSPCAATTSPCWRPARSSAAAPTVSLTRRPASSSTTVSMSSWAVTGGRSACFGGSACFTGSIRPRASKYRSSASGAPAFSPRPAPPPSPSPLRAPRL